ncbi:MAG TPA: outer membrane beta-barrel protein [Vicinamibacterales bacterium]|nr:outer membrane beta-barrel protein [Vicinamibacterales bacterium]
MTRCLALLAAMLVMAAPAAAQGLLDNGLPVEAPERARYYVGPFAISPTLIIRELGVDTNVFDEHENPKRDYVVSLSPTVDVFGKVGLLQAALTSSTDFTWYAKYANERSLGRVARGRVDFLPSRLRLSVGGGIVQTRERPSMEIELRARRSQSEAWGGVGFEISPIARVYTSLHQTVREFQDNEVYRGVVLSDALDRRTDAVEAGLALSVTPLTTLLVSGRRTEDRFAVDSRRDSDSQSAKAELTFARYAILQGHVNVGYRDFKPSDPSVSRFRGVTSAAGLSFTGFWRGHMDFDASRDVSHSFDVSEGYYVGTEMVGTYTQRVIGALDVLTRLGVGTMDYGRRAGLDAREDTMRTLAGGIGYNFNNGGRFGVTYEHETRESDSFADRRYVSRRLFGSYTYVVER